MGFADGKFAYLAYKLNPSGTVTIDGDIGVSSGRLYIVNDEQEEWINFTSNTLSGLYYVLGGITRDIDPIAIPMVSLSTGKTWLANQKVILVQGHDQIFDAANGGTISGDTVFTKSIKVPVFANITARDATITSPSNGMECYITDLGVFQDYQSGAWNTRATSTGNATQSGVQNEVYTYASDTGTANTYVIAPSPAIAGYLAGQRFQFIATNTNTGSSTVNVNSKGAIAIKKNNGSANLIAGDIVAGQIVDIIYDGTDFELQTPVYNPPSSLVKEFTLNENMTAGDVGYIDGTGVSKYIGTAGANASDINTYQHIATSGNVGVGIYHLSGQYYVRAFTRTANTLSLGTAVSLRTMTPNTIIASVVMLTSTTFVAIYGDNTVSQILYARAGTISGTTISLGSEVIVDSSISSVFGGENFVRVDNTRFAIGYTGASTARYIVAGSVSGTTIALGTTVNNGAYTSMEASTAKLVYISDGKIGLFCGSSGTDINRLVFITISGTTVSVGTSTSTPETYTGTVLYVVNIGNSKLGMAFSTGVRVADCSGSSPIFSSSLSPSVTPTSIAADNNNGLFTVFSSTSTLQYISSGSNIQLLRTISVTTGANRLLKNMGTGIFVKHASGSGFQIFTTTKYYVVGILSATGLATEIKRFWLFGGEATGYTGLIPGVPVFLSPSTGGVGHIGDSPAIGVAVSSSSIVQYNQGIV